MSNYAGVILAVIALIGLIALAIAFYYYQNRVADSPLYEVQISPANQVGGVTTITRNTLYKYQNSSPDPAILTVSSGPVPNGSQLIISNYSPASLSLTPSNGTTFLVPTEPFVIPSGFSAIFVTQPPLTGTNVHYLLIGTTPHS